MKNGWNSKIELQISSSASVLYTFNDMIENIDYFREKWKGQIEGEDILKKVTAKRFISTFKTAQPIELFDVDLYLN